jgi:hypothetical protein
MERPVCPFRKHSQLTTISMASQNRVLNVIDPALARYIKLREELERFLKDEYGKSVGESYDYNIEVGKSMSSLDFSTDMASI